MANTDSANPNEIPMMGDDELQVMSPRGALDRVPDRGLTPNGVPPPPTTNSLNMDGETVAGTSAGYGPSDGGVGRGTSQPSDQAGTEVPSSSKATMSSVSARGFLMGPPAKASSNISQDSSEHRPQASFLTGVAKAVQSIPAAVEGFMMGPGASAPTAREGHGVEPEGFASAQSGSPEGTRSSRAPQRTEGTPLLDEETLQRLNGLQASAPHLYAPEAPSSGIRPPSTTSSDIQAEVRRQLREFMMIRDEENRELRTRVELLMTENRSLRQEVSSQMYSRDQNARSLSSGRFAGLEWIGRGFGNLMSGVASPKPASPPERLMDLRPPPAPPRAPSPCPPRPTPTGPCEVPNGATSDVFYAAGASSGPDVGSRLNGSLLNPCPSVPEEVPTARTLDFEAVDPPTLLPASSQHHATRPGNEDPMSVVLTGMAQLQGVVADLANSPKQTRQEVIKPGVNTLPDLPAAGQSLVCCSQTGFTRVSQHSVMCRTPVKSCGPSFYLRPRLGIPDT